MTAPAPTRIQIENLGWHTHDDPSYRPRCNHCTWVGTLTASRFRAADNADRLHPTCAATR